MKQSPLISVFNDRVCSTVLLLCVQAPAPVQFQIVWQAASALAPSQISALSAAVWRQSRLQLLPKRPSTALLPPLAHALAQLQTRDPEKPVTAVVWAEASLSPVPPLLGPDLRGSASQGVSALLRVASSEGAQAPRSVLCMGITDACPGQQAAAVAQQAKGALSAFGARHAGRVLALPKLLPVLQTPPLSSTALSAPVLGPLGPSSGALAVITGGLGALGRLTASWLGQQGLKVVLLGRTAHAVLPEGPGWAHAAACDVSCSSDVAALLSQHVPGAPVLLVHAGGVVRDAMLSQQTAGSLREVLAAKVAGARQLQGKLLAARPSQAVLFSSIAGLLGSGGQGSYAAANSALDTEAASQQMQVR